MAKSENDRTVNLSSTQLRQIAETASAVACKAYREEAEKVKQENRDSRLYNTRLLMEKYRGLVKYSEGAIYDSTQVDKEELGLHELLDLMSTGEDSYVLTVESIKERAERTRIIVAHMNKMLDFYKYRCERSGKLEIRRKWDTVYYLYIAEDEKTTQELAKLFYVDERTVYRYNKAALQDISALFFGCVD